MSGYIVLTISLGIVGVIAYHMSGRELLSPAVVVALSLFCASALCLVGYGSWNDILLEPYCIFLITLGTLSMVIGALVPRAYVKMRASVALRLDTGTELQGANVSSCPATWKYCFLVLLVMLITVEHVVETYSIATELGAHYSGYFEAQQIVRVATSPLYSGDYTGFNDGYSFISKQLEKLTIAIGYVSAIRLGRVVRRRSNSCDLYPCMLLAVVSGVSSFLYGGRYQMLMYLISFLLSCWICGLAEKRGDQKKTAAFSRRFVAIGAGVGAFCALSLYVLSPILGRNFDASLLDYVGAYYGCGIPSFQMMLNTGFDPYNIPGFNTFHEQMSFLSKFGIYESLPGFGSYFVPTQSFISNVFTFAYRYYSDFGILGMVILSLVSGLAYGWLYERALRPGAGAVWMYVFPALACHLIDVCRDEKFFATVFSFSTLLLIVAMVAVLCFLFLSFSDIRTETRTRFFCARHVETEND